MLATAGLIDAEQATRALVTVINAFGEKFENAEKISDLFFITVQKGITTVGELANKIGRVAGMAGAAGMSMETMFTFIAAGTQVTGMTAATVTGLRSAINTLLRPGKTARDTFKRLGIEFGASSLQGNKFIHTLREMGRRLRGDLTTKDIARFKELGVQARLTSKDIGDMIPNMRASAVVLALLRNKTEDDSAERNSRRRQ